jgi:hypothetical protein
MPRMRSSEARSFSSRLRRSSLANDGRGPWSLMGHQERLALATKPVIVCVREARQLSASITGERRPVHQRKGALRQVGQAAHRRASSWCEAGR